MNFKHSKWVALIEHSWCNRSPPMSYKQECPHLQDNPVRWKEKWNHGHTLYLCRYVLSWKPVLSVGVKVLEGMSFHRKKNYFCLGFFLCLLPQILSLYKKSYCIKVIFLKQIVSIQLFPIGSGQSIQISRSSDRVLEADELTKHCQWSSHVYTYLTSRKMTETMNTSTRNTHWLCLATFQGKCGKAKWSTA